MMEQPSSRRENPRSVVRILQILEVLSDDSCEWTLSTLGREINSPKSSLLVLMRALTELGYVYLSGGVYKLHNASFRLASRVLVNRHFPQVARPILNEIVAETGETAVIGILASDNQSTIYIDKVESASALRFSAKIGDSRPLYSSASGHVLLAFGDPQVTETYLRKVTIEQLTPSGLSSRAQLKAAVDQTRAEGVAVTFDQSTVGVTGFGAPIFDGSGQLLGALVLAAPTSRVMERIDDMRHLAKQTARRISEIMGHTCEYP